MGESSANSDPTELTLKEQILPLILQKNCLAGTREDLSEGLFLLSKHSPDLALPAPSQTQLSDFVVTV
ncbi:hypothetical protein DSO57_1026628 [Entomophthora muscae]|uniref:Uncharacterized protein n=1 Tax=Entomophthora muscae TaxID=34485 RepID=A0ACC2T245_9FUNG|nr:hypothetical protein DSO57_1026628 [Entomophthora muscae]